MTDLSREELRAHLSAVEAQVRAALRIVAAESKSVQQAHSALRADLSAALIRLQSEMNDGNKRVDGKVERVISEVNGLSRQRRLTAAILTTLVLLFGITLGVFIGGGWYIASQQFGSDMQIEMPSLSSDTAPPPASSATIEIPNTSGASATVTIPSASTTGDTNASPGVFSAQ